MRLSSPQTLAMRWRTAVFAVTLALPLAVGVVHAQAPTGTDSATASLSGQITRPDSKAAIEGARVIVAETGQSTVSNRLGQYRFVLPPGQYTIVVDYLGAETAQETVVLSGDQPARLDFELGGTAAVEEIVVTARQSAAASALNQQRNADVISNVISADALGRFPDTTAAEALNRLPGVSFQRERRSGDGQFISIRGLDSALNNVKINGVNSAQGNVGGEGGANRRIPLDVFQAESISRITVNKSLLPYHESDGIGGAIELETASPLELGEDTLRLSVEGRWQEVNPDGPGFRAGGTVSKVVNDRFGILVSGSYRKRERVAFEMESILTDGGVPAPLYIPAGFDIPDTDDEGILLAPFVGTAADYPATMTGLQFSYFDDTREDTSLSTVIDFRPFENTTWKLSASYNREEVESLRNTTRVFRGEADDEDSDPDDDLWPLVADGVSVDLADLYPLIDIPRGQFMVSGGDEIHALAEAEIRLRFEAEPEENTNLTVGFAGETYSGNWTFNYNFGYAKAEDGFANGPRPQFDFEPEDFDDQDYIDYLADNGISGISPSDIFPDGEVFTTSDSGVGNGILAPGSDSGFTDGRLFWLFSGVGSSAPQFANVNNAALQQLFLTPEVYLINGYTLDLEEAEQERYFAEFNVEFLPAPQWFNSLRAGIKYEVAERESFDLEIAGFNSGETEAILLEALGDIDANGDGDLSLAEVDSGLALLSGGTIALSDFDDVYPYDILEGSIAGVDRSEEVFNNFLANIASSGTGIDLDDVIGDIQLPDGFDPATQNFLDFIPIEEIDEEFFSAYLMGNFSFGRDGRWELIGGVRVEHGTIETRSTQSVGIETVDRDGAGLFIGVIDDGANPLDGEEIRVDANGNVFDLDGVLLGVRDTIDGGTIGVDLETSTDQTVSILKNEADFTEVLPRFQLNYRASENLVFRGAVWTAIARPAFEDLSAAGEIEFEESTEEPGENARLRVEFGNPNLDNSYAWNFDLGAEYYFGNIGLVSVNLFYKDIQDFIFVDLTPIPDLESDNAPEGLETAAPGLFDSGLINLADAVAIRQPQGGTDATIFGVETSFQRRLDFLPGWAEGFGIFANLTWQDPEADVLLSDGTFVELPFFNSPEVVGTFSLYYDAFGIDAALSYSYQSDQLSSYQNNFAGTLYEPDYDQWDLNIKYELPLQNQDIMLALSVQDLTNSGDDPVTRLDYGTGGRLTDEVQFVGRSIFFGVTASF